MADEERARARRILASIFDEDEMPCTADHIRNGGSLIFSSVEMPLRAIVAALRLNPTRDEESKGG